jgi:CDP-paratose 2-epimerase
MLVTGSSGPIGSEVCSHFHRKAHYGGSKLASELLCLEDGQAFGFPVWVNRCGVMAGAGQLGTAEQGMFSYWLHAHRARQHLRYIGFGGTGEQMRDALHPEDLADLLMLEMREPGRTSAHIWNIAGGIANAISLAELTGWCNERFGRHEPQPDLTPRPFDIPWLVLDSGRASAVWGWSPRRTLLSILEEIACPRGEISELTGGFAKHEAGIE